MPILRKRREAERLYESGRMLFESGRYALALTELEKAEEAFRALDVRGHPFSHVLENGVSGLANTLALKAQCYEHLGDCTSALTAYETCLINARFERRRPFRRFWDTLRIRMASCCEEKARVRDSEHIAALLKDPAPSINTTLTFPYSLDPDRAALARLYELAPERYAQFRDFYYRAQAQDRRARQQKRDRGFASIRNVGIAVWGTLAALWFVYGVLTVRALLLKK